MSDKNKPHPSGPFDSQDADFGVFQPMGNPIGATQFPAYNAWTQFSGIPPSPGDPASFGWHSLDTPPNTPIVEINSSDYYTNLSNVMQGLGKSNATFDSNVATDNDKLASTPVAQSLLEALSSSNPVMPPGQDDGLPPMHSPLDFEQVSQDGYDIYADALKTLGTGSNYPSYDPFGSTDVLNSSPSATPPPRDADHQGNSKPSFAEVAKTLKANQNSSKEKDDIAEPSKKRTSESSRSFKSSKKFIPRPIRGRNNGIPVDMCPTVSPDSKYGLDDFGDVGSKKAEKDDLDTGLDEISIPVVTRKNSCSSISSSTSGVEEIQVPKSVNSYCNSGDSSGFKKISNKDKEKGLDKGANKPTKNEKPFFDASRIFQSETKDTNKRCSQSKLANEATGPTILNNGKPSYGAWCSSAAHKKSTHYINNNLRDSQKKTNQNPATGLKGQTIPPENVYPQNQNNSRSEKSSRSRQGSAKNNSSTAKPEMPLQTSFDHELIDEWLSFLYDKAKLCLHQLWTLVLMVILLIFSIIVYLVSGCVHITTWLWGKLWMFLETKVFKGKLFGNDKWKKSSSDAAKNIGLEENITLPSTGDEAMQRLLACKGKDPYSILGLKSTALDDEIKKYYRKQAVLVHPDKNQQPGAEEAFKILGHAFELIGDPSKREAYDRQLQEAKEAEAAMREFNDLLTKLQEKIQQASNMMRCDNCGGKHKRMLVERPWYSARYCNRCLMRHSAKEGDVWAETSMLGFLWHYYACMEGKVYDITEWVACKKEFFKHMQANAHHVFYRIATEGNRSGHRGRTNTGPETTGANSEADLEDFISHLFHQAMNSDGNTTTSQNWQPPQTNGQTWNSSGNTNSTSTTNPGKRQKRKKKKH
ncbi:subfamily C member 14 [Mactra antiquata]